MPPSSLGVAWSARAAPMRLAYIFAYIDWKFGTRVWVNFE